MIRSLFFQKTSDHEANLGDSSKELSLWTKPKGEITEANMKEDNPLSN